MHPEQIALMKADPLAFVLFAFPWGEPGELAAHKGPRTWQRELLEELGLAMKEKKISTAHAIQIARASGHGIGKSALVAWLILWALSTSADCKVIVTANTDTQLRTKTWPELAKWHRLLINRDWFNFTATSLYSADPEHEKTWRADAIPWSENNTEAFAGLHNQGGRILVVFDEASSIPDAIWQVAEGTLTDEDTEIIWCAFGNPTRNTGRFRECFGRLAHRWHGKQIDSRTVEGTNKTQIDKWIADYGDDSDFARVRVKGQFPNASTAQFIGGDLVSAARTREAISHHTDPIILGVDVAREGDDESVIACRMGYDARTIGWKCLRVPDTMLLVGHVTNFVKDLQRKGLPVAQIAVDVHGMGVGVADRLKQLGYPVMGAYNWPDPSDPEYHNPGDRWWADMREWLKNGALPDDNVLADQLTSREFGFDGRNRLSLEKTGMMKARGLSSPDRAAALAMTFAFPVMPLGLKRPAATQRVKEYDAFGETENDFNPMEYA